MNKNYEEKRLFSRIKADLKVGISKGTNATSFDISESGIGINFSEVVASPKVSLQIHFPDVEIKTEARLVWRRDLEGGGSSYGMEFVNLTEHQKSELRKELITTQINTFLNEIKQVELKKQISDFFLNDMLNYINEVFKIISHLPKENEYSEEIEKKLEELHTQIILKGYCLEELLGDKNRMQKVKDNFRQLVSSWIYKSIIMRRAFEKPRGYPGDHRMLETVYDNKPISKNAVGVYFDNYFLKNPYAVAVRIRKDRLRELLRKFITETKLKKVNILDIACGSCREIKELLHKLRTDSHVTFTCLDWDDEALDFSKDALLSISPKNVDFKFVKEDIMNIIKSEKVAQSLGKQDLIYSIGLIDYLPDRVLKKLIYALYELLEKDGQLILTHKNREKTFPPLPPDWFCDWKFVPRNKEEVVKLFYDCGFSGFILTSESDDFEHIFYFTITKK